MDLSRKVKKDLKEAKKIYYEKLMNKELKPIYSIVTLKRFAIQYVSNPKKYDSKFFPSKREENFIRKEWKKGFKSKKQFNHTSSNYLIQYIGEIK